ncbi:MAG TPA: hypothetical protein P5318_13195 [Candidatus Hydrogenedentes bacterium]|nr:hypothetical protein [Candidatus Hydrogenedentota bacterium]HRT21075.1 hypothetical protein [Candidatus Hydrogenedentota bacterium]HRT66052.1 hypothetical protein [Candidatus Hydrogenedentota bacterium]
MGSDKPAEIRIYCICGQKMKVSESMFGLPGKCVACRQRIRIPTKGELAPGTTEVYLKDRPEFLRKPSRKKNGVAPKAAPSDEAEGIELGDRSDLVSAAILDILEPLRVLCSLSHKLQSQAAAMKAGEGGILAGDDPAALNAYIARVRDARAELDDHLRQRLMETAIELSSTSEKIVQAGLSLRIGETSLEAFRDTVDRLRHRRDHLERLQQNIRGWLTVTDPHTAGGYANVSLDAIPESGFQPVLPSETSHSRSLFDEHISALREALLRRERAELRLNETKRLRTGASMSASVLADCRAHAQAEKARADAEVTFRRKRLEQLSADYAGDVQTIQAARDRLARQLKEGTIDISLHNSLERDMVRAQNDCASVHSVIARALIASAPQDVPSPHGSLIRRMARPVVPPGMGSDTDSWIAWSAAIALGLSVFLPVVDDLSPVRAYQEHLFRGQTAHWAMTLPILVGVLVTLAGALPWRMTRGVALTMLWLGVTVAAAGFIHEAQYGTGAAAVRFRQGLPWIYRPGILLMLAADLSVLVAATVALAPYRIARVIIPVACCICGTAILGISTDWAGLRGPRPELSVTWSDKAAQSDGAYEVSVAVNNKGKRPVLIGPGTGRNATIYLLERFRNDMTWEDVSFLKPHDVRQVAPGETALFHHSLKPGIYRASLRARNTGNDAAVVSFTLPEIPEKTAESPATESLSSTPVPAETGVSTSSEPMQEGAKVELRGIVNGESRGPRFSLVLYPPDGKIAFLDLGLGEMVYGDWIASEYNPERQTVTLAKNGELLILNRGQLAILP